MKTYFDKITQTWVNYKSEIYWSGLICSETGDKIYINDVYQVLNAAGWDRPVTLTCTEDTCNNANTWYSNKKLKYRKLR